MKKNQKKSPALLKSTEKARQVAASAKVGKGSPPEAFKWRPGQSGNPSGLPSAHREVIVASVKDMLAQVDPKLNKNLFERLLEQCARRALQGSKWHMGVLLDYGLGKPTQPLEHEAGVNLREVLRKARERADAELPDTQQAPALPDPANAHATRQAQAATDATAQDSAREDDEEQAAAETRPSRAQRIAARRIVVM